MKILVPDSRSAEGNNGRIVFADFFQQDARKNISVKIAILRLTSAASYFAHRIVVSLNRSLVSISAKLETEKTPKAKPIAIHKIVFLVFISALAYKKYI